MSAGMAAIVLPLLGVSGVVNLVFIVWLLIAGSARTEVEDQLRRSRNETKRLGRKLAAERVMRVESRRPTGGPAVSVRDILDKPGDS